jgi:hypothetical protein
VQSNAYRWIGDREQLGVLMLPFLDLSNLLVIRCSKLVKPKVRVPFRVLSVPVWTGLLRTHYSIIC